MNTSSIYSSKFTASNEIPFYKPTISVHEIKSVLEAILSDKITFGETVLLFEKECAQILNFSYGISTSSLTAAYHLALISLGIQEGDEVIIPSTLSISILDAIHYIKAKPVIIDIDKNTFHPSETIIKEKITSKTKLVILNYLYGSFCNYGPLTSFLKEQNIHSIEDVSEIVGMEFENQFIGSNADLAIVSFHDNMPLTIGKGAVILTNNHNHYHILKDIRIQGGSKPYKIRYDYTITEYQAAMGLAQLDKLSLQLESRKKIGKLYLESLTSQKLMTYFQSSLYDNYFTFPIITSDKFNHLKSYFNSLKINTLRSLNHDPLHRLLNLNANEYYNTEKLYEKGLLLPMYASLSKKQVEHITSSLKKYY